MEFRRAEEADICPIMKIIKQAQNYFKIEGINQWQNNYPNEETIRKDIINNNGYVLIKEHIIIGTVALIFEGEKTYETIYDGKWISNQEFAVIHRLAVDIDCKGLGLAGILIKNIEELCTKRNIHSIKVDTHMENVSMQQLLKKSGFQYCGIIYLEDKSKRIAFEKIL